MPDKIQVVHMSKKGLSSVEFPNHVTSLELNDISSPILKKRESGSGLGTNKSVNRHSNRSVQFQVSHQEVIHDDLVNAEVIDKDAQYALPTNLLVTGVLHVLLGLISISISMVLYFADSIIEEFLEACGSHSHFPAFFVFISEILTIIVGISLIVSLLYKLDTFFRLYPHFLWIIVMFDFVAIMFSLGSWRHLNMSAYARMFESEALIFCEGDYEYYNILWNRPPDSKDLEPRIWAKLESTVMIS